LSLFEKNAKQKKDLQRTFNAFFHSNLMVNPTAIVLIVVMGIGVLLNWIPLERTLVEKETGEFALQNARLKVCK
jgi:hypothetical protein